MMNFGPSPSYFEAMHGESRGFIQVVPSCRPYPPGDTANGRLIVETFFRCTAVNISGDAVVVFEDGEEQEAAKILETK